MHNLRDEARGDITQIARLSHALLMRGGAKENAANLIAKFSMENKSSTGPTLWRRGKLE